MEATASVAQGVRLGPYEVVSFLGRGGMGEVWSGRDTRLDRTVAIKILPAAFADDRERRLRFEREAKAISQLEHPHICRLYDVGPGYLVMELVDGEPLAARLLRGPMPQNEVLRYGAEIADALDAAHRAGIVHRDLKPANVMITRSGTRLLDFGLAKAVSTSPDHETTTIENAITAAGTIAGTVQYMAPEQLEGREVDARTDIFALGGVLYEMITGMRAFSGTSRASIIAAIVRDDPRPISELQPLVAPALERLVARCLAKAPEARWQSAADIADELRWVSTSSFPSGPARKRERRRTRAAWAAAAAVLATLGAGAAWLAFHRTTQLADVVRFTVPLVGSERESYRTGFVAIPPDGKSFVYSSVVDGVRQLYLRRLDSLDSVPINGTTGALQPFFSRDGRWIGFFAHHKLMKIPVEGGTPIQLSATTEQPGGGWWADDGSILFSPSMFGGVIRRLGTDGSLQALTELDPARDEIAHQFPAMLPGGKAFLYTVNHRPGADTVAQRVGSSERKMVVKGAARARYVDGGYLVYQKAGSLFGVKFDPVKLETVGEEVALGDVASGEWAASPSGALLVMVPNDGTAASGGVMKIVDRDGHPLPAPPGLQEVDAWGATWSPDETKIAAVRRGEVSVFDMRRNTWTTLGSGYMPAWTADSKRVAWARSRAIYWRAADAADDEQQLTSAGIWWTYGVSPDSSRIMIGRVDPVTSYDIFTVDTRSRELRPWMVTPMDEGHGTFSPDGRWVAFQWNASGLEEICLAPFDGSKRWQISGGNENAITPVWKSPGEVFYQSPRGIMSVTVATTPEFSAGAPRLVLPARMFQNLESFDVTTDGRRFLIVDRRASGPEHINVIVSWNADLARKFDGVNTGRSR